MRSSSASKAPLDIIGDAAAHEDEGLHDHRALVADLPEGSGHLLPGQAVGGPGGLAVALAHMEVAQQIPSLQNGLEQIVLLDVHVEGVQH